MILLKNSYICEQYNTFLPNVIIIKFSFTMFLANLIIIRVNYTFTSNDLNFWNINCS